MDHDISNWPLVYQIAAYAAAALAGLYMYIRGNHAGPSEEDAGVQRLREEQKELCEQVNGIFDRLRVLERDVAVLFDRQGRPRGRQ